MLITYETRIKIELLLKEGYSLANIARRLNLSRSTITREVRRGTQDSSKNNRNYPTNLIKSMYRARDAQFRAENRRHHVGRHSSLTQYKRQIIMNIILPQGKLWQSISVYFPIQQSSTPGLIIIKFRVS